MANTRADKKVVFVAYGASPTDYSTLRYGLASALMDNGLFMFIPASGSQVPAWYDEYSAQARQGRSTRRLRLPRRTASTCAASRTAWCS